MNTTDDARSSSSTDAKDKGKKKKTGANYPLSIRALMLLPPKATRITKAQQQQQQLFCHSSWSLVMQDR